MRLSIKQKVVAIILTGFLAVPLAQAQTERSVCVYKPFFAIKTNLLYNLATALNIEVEVSMGKRWSVAGEWIFPWWKWEEKDVTFQLLAGSLEGRYWFGKRDHRPVLTGWFASAFAGVGLYDFLFTNKEGRQGEFFIMGGLGAGYAHAIGRHFRMEYEIGVGYLQSDYRPYLYMEDTAYGNIKTRKYPWPENRSTWIGPVKAKVSFVWMIGKKGGTQ